METILHLRKELIDPPVERARAGAGVSIRAFIVPDDVEGWLTLRSRATAGLSPQVREWSRNDFAAQMLAKPWWRNEWTWLAMGPQPGESPIGAVTLGLRMGAKSTVPIVHWLLVDSTWRRRGVGRMLMSRLESAAWVAGYRQVELETHANWKDAVAFYQSMGYAPVRERSPR
ncbi:MAG TPA: GNAT family N-acetyltransferase [Lacipirellulaceae bacterium]|jgi:GNAT superfamily N-acetyltransferase|nr:GNAT family N-acetyltransferase [Lacipirellulaceae bacterium]